MNEKNRFYKVAVITAYNEEKTIAKVVLQTQRFVDKVIICDDGSRDMTATIAKRLGALVIKNSINRGKGEAFRMSFKEVMALNPDIIVTLDADGQHDPNQIPSLIRPIMMGECDVVVGSRYVGKVQEYAPFYRKVGLALINFLCRKTLNLSVKDTQSGFRAYSLKAFQVISSCEEKGYGVESEELALAARNGLTIAEIPVNIKYKDLEKTSKKSSLLHGGELILTIIRLVAEERPLIFLGVPGIILSSMGLTLAIYLLWLFNITRFFSIPIAIITLGVLFTGLLLVIAAVTMHGFARIVDKINKKT